MNFMKCVDKKLLFIGMCLFGHINGGMPPLNLFAPYDFLLIPRVWPYTNFQINIADELLVHARAYQADDDELCDTWRKRKDVLQLWQDDQDALAAVKGDLSDNLGQFAPLFAVDDNGTIGHIIPYGKLEVNNFMLSAWYNFSCLNLRIAAHLPIFDARLKNVVWKDVTPAPAGMTANDYVNALEVLGNVDLGGWHRQGIGDLATLVYWFGDNPQAKQYLKNVRLALRGGLTYPTGKKSDVNKLFAIPFGYGSGLGIIGAGTIELWFNHHIRGGIDGQFLQLFGSTARRRIKIDQAQTDLLLLTTATTYREFGFNQHYTIFIEAAHFWRGLSAKIAYQYTKQHESKLFVCSDHFDPIIVNSAENLDEFTTHHMVFNLSYDFYKGEERTLKPYLQLFYKHGFNGKRAVLADTITASLSVSF
ncbi:MAG: hypothetical protein WC707_06525 [Candidatus Babeliaceae bacterium]|jgi:hypothetical protein